MERPRCPSSLVGVQNPEKPPERALLESGSGAAIAWAYHEFWYDNVSPGLAKSYRTHAKAIEDSGVRCWWSLSDDEDGVNAWQSRRSTWSLFGSSSLVHIHGAQV